MITRNKFDLTLKAITASAIISTASLMAAEASTITPRFESIKLNQPLMTNHAVFLKCKIDDNREYQSKAVLFSLRKPLMKQGRDIAVVTGHGLEASQNCYIQDFQGHSEKITSISFAKDYKAGTETDWALVSFKAFKGEHLKRFHIDEYLKDIKSLDKANISFAQARGLPSNTQICRLALITLSVPKHKNSQYVSHNCKAIPGQSGSPLTRIVNGRHKLIGFHLGNIWTLNSPITGKPGSINFLRPYDKKMSEDIQRIIETME